MTTIIHRAVRTSHDNNHSPGGAHVTWQQPFTRWCAHHLATKMSLYYLYRLRHHIPTHVQITTSQSQIQSTHVSSSCAISMTSLNSFVVVAWVVQFAGVCTPVLHGSCNCLVEIHCKQAFLASCNSIDKSMQSYYHAMYVITMHNKHTYCCIIATQ